jgi:hypothetical protein
MKEIHPIGDLISELGGLVPNGTGARQAFLNAKLLDWNVRKAPLYAYDRSRPGGSDLLKNGIPLVEYPDRYVILWDSPFSGNTEISAECTDSYEPLQNELLLDLVETVVESTKATVLSARWHEYKRRVITTLDLNQTHLVGGIDPVKFLIHGATSHDKSFTLRFRLTPFRLACENMMTASMPDINFEWRTMHTRNAPEKISDLKNYLGNIQPMIEKFMTDANKMFDTHLSDEEIYQTCLGLIAEYLDVDGDRLDQLDYELDDEIVRLAETVIGIHDSPTVTAIKNTAWGGLQAFLEWMQYVMPTSNTRGKNAVGDSDSYIRASRAVFPEKAYTDLAAKAFFAFDGATSNSLTKGSRPAAQHPQEFWEETMGGGWEFDNCWERIEYHDGAAWNKIGRFTITGQSPDSVASFISVNLGIEDLLNANEVAIAKGYGHCGGGWDWQEQDVCTSSGILQIAVYGDVIFE